MRIAYIVLCHKNPKQINDLISLLSNDNNDFYLHLDRKSDIENKIILSDNVFILNKDKRIDIRWGQNSMLKATMNLLREVIKSKKEYDYVWLISGQDFPIKSQTFINEFLEKRKGQNFIRIIGPNNSDYKKYLKRNTLYYPKWIVNDKVWIKVLKKFYIYLTGGANRTYIAQRSNNTGLNFYFGSQWWALTYDCVKYIYEYVNRNPGIINFFENSVVPDECLFQTIFMHSPFKDFQSDYLTFIDWGENKRSPKVLKYWDLERLLKNNNYLLARKFDEDIDRKVIDRLKKELN